MATEQIDGAATPSSPSPADFRGSGGSVGRSILALTIWLGSIHLKVAIVLCSFLFLPLHKFSVVLGMLVIFMVLPMDDKSKWGRKL